MDNNNDKQKPVPQTEEVEAGIRDSVAKIDAISRPSISLTGHGRTPVGAGISLPVTPPRNEGNRGRTSENKKCHNCGSSDHLVRRCPHPKHNRFVFRANAINESFHDMDDRTKAAEDVAREKEKEIKDLKEELKEAKEVKEVEQKFVPEYDVEGYSMSWASQDSDHRFIDHNEKARHNSVLYKFPTESQGEYESNSYIIFDKPKFSMVLPVIGGIFTAYLACSATKMLLTSALTCAQIMCKKLELIPPACPASQVIRMSTYVDVPGLPITTIAGGLKRLFFTLPALALTLASTRLTEMLNFSNVLKTFKYFRIEFGDTVDHEPADCRADSISAGDLTHENPQNHMAKFSTIEVTSFFGVLAIAKRVKRKNIISLETFVQLTNPNNIVISSTDQVAWDRIQYTNTHLHSVNLNRYHTTDDNAIDVDSQLAAYGRRREILQQRSCDDFRRGTQA